MTSFESVHISFIVLIYYLVYPIILYITANAAARLVKNVFGKHQYSGEGGALHYKTLIHVTA